MVELSEYSAWHGTRPMKTALENLDSGSFLVEGRGVRVRDQAGRWYLDGRSSLWNLTLGHDHPKVISAIREQLDSLPFGTLLSYGRPPAVSIQFANALAARLPAGLRHIRLGNTGSQMTESAVLLSRFFRQEAGEPRRTAVISFDGSYHGTGPCATALSGHLQKAHEWCGPLMDDVHQVPAEGSWHKAVQEQVAALGPDRVTAVIFEPLMGSVGTIPDPGDLARMVDYCRGQGIHVIADEVTTGYGRIGHLSRVLQLGIHPDMIVFSKGITAGYVPGAALAVCDEIFDPLASAASGRAFIHGSTTDGHPLAAAAGLAVLEVLYEDGVMDSVAHKSEVLRAALERVQREFVPGGEIAGTGLMLKFALRDEQGQTWSREEVNALHAACEEAGLLVSIAIEGLWVLPPLVISVQECEEIAELMATALKATLADELH
ncbi:aminotransferase class III-fold pyridoxal phosphate-dependent enzyme [Streptomyces sp. NBC_00258]|uniref:aminotransferase class III-fold pyridoxal phosphate-dependent enzyme n=1 Tax=Streptomyces sp. NBC_00258 TaxID=2903642 RepID=UPI002E27D749|nr:aminotransferase class III-fold pyridoxal phosphate-dependent enzyme [Streptomyces sp. NBC_00258]